MRSFSNWKYKYNNDYIPLFSIRLYFCLSNLSSIILECLAAYSSRSSLAISAPLKCLASRLTTGVASLAFPTCFFRFGGRSLPEVSPRTNSSSESRLCLPRSQASFWSSSCSCRGPPAFGSPSSGLTFAIDAFHADWLACCPPYTRRC